MARQQTRTKTYPLGGGLDVVTDALSIPPGRCLAMVNYEPFYNGGYRRCAGFERFDGRPKPSEATFTGFKVSTVAGLTLGTTVTGAVSGATGVVVGIWDDDGTYGFDAIGVTKVTGTFVNAESITGGGSRTVTSTPEDEYAPSSGLETTWLLEAQDEYRDDIAVVPGEDPVRGVWRRGDTVYAIRDDNDSGYQAVLHRASASGWTTSGITMCQYIYFDGGGGGTAQALPAEGTTINGQTSGATAVVHRIVEHGGATGTNDAYGYIVLRSVSGNFRDNENLRVSSTKFADSASVNMQFGFPPGGTYRFINHNFFGSSSTYRTYGVNGIGAAFEIDENHYVSPILLPQTAIADQPASNVPFLIEEHRNHLFLGFPGGSLVHTVIGEPLTVNGFLGAAEFGMGAEMTGLYSIAGGVLVITTDGFTKGLYGSDVSDWDLKLIGEKTGGKLDTVQLLDTVYALDDLGVTSLARVQTFGDFAGSTVSQLVQPLITTLRSQVTTSTIVRASNQYRLYFEDASALVMFVPAAGQVSMGIATPQNVQFGYLSYPFAVSRIYNSEDENGVERTYFVSDDADAEGYVYEDQIGTSFDGENIASYLRLAFAHLGSPGYRKHFRRADLGINASEQVELQVVHDLSYGNDESNSATAAMTSGDVPVLDIFGGGGFWDTSNWNEFEWDGQSLSTARVTLDGTGENISFVVYNESASADPFVLNSMTIHYELRRLQR